MGINCFMMFMKLGNRLQSKSLIHTLEMLSDELTVFAIQGCLTAEP